MSIQSLTVTIDSNCINTRMRLAAMNELERLHSLGVVQLVKTDVMDTEFGNWEGERGQAARAKSQEFEEDIGVMVVGHSRIGFAMLAGESDVELYDSVANSVFGKRLKELSQNQIRDSMLIATHIKNGRDILVTQDIGILDAAEVLLARYSEPPRV
jgi:hypothetical protein